MPAFLAAIPAFFASSTGIGLSAALGAAGAATSIGSTIYSDTHQPDMSQLAGLSQQGQPPPPSASDNIANETAKRMQQAMAVRQQQPGLQSSLGDSVSPDYLNILSSQGAGVFGDNPGTVNPLGLNSSSADLSGNGGNGGNWASLAGLTA